MRKLTTYLKREDVWPQMFASLICGVLVVAYVGILWEFTALFSSGFAHYALATLAASGPIYGVMRKAEGK